MRIHNVIRHCFTFKNIKKFPVEENDQKQRFTNTRKQKSNERYILSKLSKKFLPNAN